MPQDVHATQSPTRPASRRLWRHFWTRLFWLGVGAVRSLFGCLDRDPNSTEPTPTKRPCRRLGAELLEERSTPDDIASLLGFSALSGLINPIDLFGGQRHPVDQVAVVANNVAPRVQLPAADRHPERELDEPRRDGVEPGDCATSGKG